MIYSPETNLRKLIEIIEQQPEHTVNLIYYRHPCGTIFCSLGHAACDPFFQAQGLRFEERTVKGQQYTHLTVNGCGAFGHIDPHIEVLFGAGARHVFDTAGNGYELFAEDFPIEPLDGDIVDRGTLEKVSDKQLALARLRWQLAKVCTGS